MRCTHQRQRNGGVIHVLGSQTEVHKFANLPQSQSIHFLLEEVFNSLHIVVGHPFKGFDAIRIGFAKIPVNVAQRLRQFGREIGKRWQRNLGQGQEVFYFDFHPVAD